MHSKFDFFEISEDSANARQMADKPGHVLSADIVLGIIRLVAWGAWTRDTVEALLQQLEQLRAVLAPHGHAADQVLLELPASSVSAHDVLEALQDHATAIDQLGRVAVLSAIPIETTAQGQVQRFETEDEALDWLLDG